MCYNSGQRTLSSCLPNRTEEDDRYIHCYFFFLAENAYLDSSCQLSPSCSRRRPLAAKACRFSEAGWQKGSKKSSGNLLQKGSSTRVFESAHNWGEQNDKNSKTSLTVIFGGRIDVRVSGSGQYMRRSIAVTCWLIDKALASRVQSLRQMLGKRLQTLAHC